MNNKSGRILKFSAYILLSGVVGFFGGSYAGKLVPKTYASWTIICITTPRTHDIINKIILISSVFGTNFPA